MQGASISLKIGAPCIFVGDKKLVQEWMRGFT